MSAARSIFLARLKAFQSSAAVTLLSDRAPTEIDHNARASLLRNGLAVVGFAVLEDFIKARVAEVTMHIASQGVSFPQLPEELRAASTHGALNGLQYQAEMQRRQRDDPTAFIQGHAANIASTAGAAFKISDLAFGRNRPNLSHEDIKVILGAFVIKDAWRNMARFTIRAGIALLSVDDAFRNAARRRHRAAHSGGEQIPQADLEAFRNEAFAIALGFDVLLSRAGRLIGAGDPAIIAATRTVQDSEIGIQFLDAGRHGFREVPEGRKRALRVFANAAIGRAQTLAQAASSNSVLIVRDRGQMPIEWETTDCP